MLYQNQKLKIDVKKENLIKDENTAQQTELKKKELKKEKK